MTVDQYPDELPDRRCVHIRGLPRTGKSYYGISQMGKNESGTYISQNHAVIEQQFKNFAKLFPDKTAVHLLGKSRACNRSLMDKLAIVRKCPLMQHPIRTGKQGHLKAGMTYKSLARSTWKNTEQVQLHVSPIIGCNIVYCRACERL